MLEQDEHIKFLVNENKTLNKNIKQAHRENKELKFIYAKYTELKKQSHQSLSEVTKLNEGTSRPRTQNDAAQFIKGVRRRNQPPAVAQSLDVSQVNVKTLFGTRDNSSDYQCNSIPENAHLSSQLGYYENRPIKTGQAMR